MREKIGYAHLAEAFGIPIPIRITTERGPSPKVSARDGVIHKIVQRSSVTPQENPVWHVDYALRNEGVELAFLATLFRKIPPAKVTAFILEAPLGQSRRRLGFLYEMLTGEVLEVKPIKIKAVPVLPEDEYIGAANPARNGKWAVLDNLLGTDDFCPVVRKTAAMAQAVTEDYGALLSHIRAEYPRGLYERALGWLYRKETGSTFAIEHETAPAEREERFIALLKTTGESPLRERLSEASLIALQKRTLDEDFAPKLGFRERPNFVGRSDPYYGATVDYLCPTENMVEGIMRGLADMTEKSVGTAPVVRAACLSFGFVYCHPLEDGNGRIHRFLMGDSLTADGVFPKGAFVPISPQIHADMPAYDRALESQSSKIMRIAGSGYRFNGITGELEITPETAAALSPLWRYPDFTAQCEYFADTLKKSLTIGLANELHFLGGFDRFATRLKGIVDLPAQENRLLLQFLMKYGAKVPKQQRGQIPISAVKWATIITAFTEEVKQRPGRPDDATN